VAHRKRPLPSQQKLLARSVGSLTVQLSEDGLSVIIQGFHLRLSPAETQLFQQLLATPHRRVLRGHLEQVLGYAPNDKRLTRVMKHLADKLVAHDLIIVGVADAVACVYLPLVA